MLCLKPDEFYALTAGEFRELLDGWAARREMQLRDMALVVAHIVAPWTKRSRVTPKKLYNAWTKPETGLVQKQKDFKELMRRMELKRRQAAINARGIDWDEE